MSKPKAFKVVVGINYPGKGGEKRAEPEEIVTDLPAKSLDWLLEGGYIEAIDEGGQ